MFIGNKLLHLKLESRECLPVFHLKFHLTVKFSPLMTNQIIIESNC